MLYSRKFYNADDGTEGGDTEGEKPTPPNPLDAVKDIANAFREEIAAMRATPAPPPAPTPAPVDQTAALRAEGEEMVKKYNEMCANGEFAEATIMMKQFEQKVANATRGSADDDPAVKAAVSFGRRAAQKDNPALFEKWGGEIDAIIKKMPVADRIQPDAWDRAMREVQMVHLDELKSAWTQEAVENARKNFAPPSAPGSRGRTKNSEPMLSEEEAAFAEICGVSAERYAFRVKEAEEFSKRPYRERGSLSDGFPLLPDGPIKPGSF